MKKVIDVRSDTVSVPPQQMREIMAQAQIGIDTYYDDKAALRFQQRIANYFGKQDALIIPTTTMANLTSIKLWTHPGQQVIIWGHSHTIDRQVTGISTIGGVQTLQLYGDSGVFDPQIIKSKIKKEQEWCMIPPTKLIYIENATFSGDVWPLQSLQRLKNIAQENSLKVHIDGARILNAIAYYKCDPKQIGQYFDSMSVCLSKGLCCPIGSVLIGSRQAMLRARTIRKSLGGAMNQIGFIAAAGNYALQNMIKQISIDNEMAKYLGKKLSQIPEIKIDIERIKINMVNFSFKDQKFDHQRFYKYMISNDIKIKPLNKDSQKYRFTIHRVIRQSEIDIIIQKIQTYFKQL